MQKQVEQKALRVIGILLIAVSVSGGSFLVNPGDNQSLSQGNGGILGIATGHFLMSHTALFGAALILIAGALVGMLLAADNIVLMLPRLLMHIAEQFRLAGPVLAGVGTRANRVTRRVKESGLEAISKASLTTVAGAGIAAEKDEGKGYEEEYYEDEVADEDVPEDEYEVVEVEEGDEPQEEGEDQEYEYEYEYVDVEEGDDDEAAEDEGDDDVVREPEVTDEKPANEESDGPAVREELPPISGPTVSALAKMLGRKSTPDVSPGGADRVDYSNYIYPPVELLDQPETGFSKLQEKAVKKRARILEQTLREFNLDTEVVAAETGPVITMFELKLAPGIKVSQITNLSNDLARSLGAPSVRVVAPIPGKHTIGIEAPNSQKETVRIKELIQLAGDRPGKMQIPLFLGKDASGSPLVSDLTAMPHCLIAGTTGSGKSVCINSIITSILLTQRPDMVKLILVDPKMVEMNSFANLSHLMCPIITEMKRAEQILEWLTTKMDERYSLLAKVHVRNISGFNKLTEEQIYERTGVFTEEEKARTPIKLPYLVVVIDELADLMMTSAKEVESYIVRLAQKSRAVGIHLVLATQRPQATVVTGLIKSNMPSRISFRVAARMDSRIVLDSNGAETLLGQGDMLFLKPGTSDLLRAQGAFISDSEINRITTHLKEVSQPSYHPELMQMNRLGEGSSERDELFDEAVKIVLNTRRGSVSLLQRQLTIGYSRASRLIDQMAEAGLVGEYKGSQAREVSMTLKEYESIKRQMEIDSINGYADMKEDDGGSAPTGKTDKRLATVNEPLDGAEDAVDGNELQSEADGEATDAADEAGSEIESPADDKIQSAVVNDEEDKEEYEEVEEEVVDDIVEDDASVDDEFAGGEFEMEVAPSGSDEEYEEDEEDEEEEDDDEADDDDEYLEACEYIDDDEEVEGV